MIFLLFNVIYVHTQKLNTNSSKITYILLCIQCWLPRMGKVMKGMSLLVREWVEGRMSRDQDKACNPEEKDI